MIVGGLDSLIGTIIAAMIIGLSEIDDRLSGCRLGGGFSTVATSLMLIAVLMMRPDGPFGHVHEARV